MSVVDLKVVALDAVYRELDQSYKTTDAVLNMDDVIAGMNIGKEGLGSVGARLVAAPCAGLSPAEHFRVGKEHQVRRTIAEAPTLIELALHKACTGAYPGQLGELKIADGDDVRLDPFTGKFFGYRLENGGPLLYSRSENGQDDGGKHSPLWGQEVKGGSDDYVFWPPQPGR